MDCTGQIFDVERFSTVDGPGIRTVAFLKGCNLHCDWCHNPEGYQTGPQLMYDEMQCMRCGGCVQVCPRQVHRLDGDTHRMDWKRCIACFRCAAVCPGGALKQAGKSWTAEELCRELLQDLPFFQESGGGVTLSGGEVMCQQEFAGQVLRRLHRQGVHTAIETNLCFPIEDYRKLRPEVDLMMFDLKSTQEEAHRRYTGVSNEQILFNVKALAGDDWREMPLIARTPVVPGFNDTEEEISAIAARLTEHRNLLYYELLAYHPLGINKKAQLGKEAGKVLPIPSKERMETLAAAAARYLPHVKVNGVSRQEGALKHGVQL